MKIGYIASHIYRHTFEINEVIELRRQHPAVRVYNFYRPRGRELQMDLMRVVQIPISIWSPVAVIGGFFYLALHAPIGLVRGVLRLAWYSLPNPVYWVKNLAAFAVAMAVLADAQRRGVTHLHANFGSSPATIAWLGKAILGISFSVTFHAFDIYVDAASANDPLRKTKLRDAARVVSVHEDGRRALREWTPAVDASKFDVIHISVVFDALPRLNHPSAPPLILAAGNLVGQKGFDVLIRAVGVLKRGGVDVRLRILGEGPDRRALEELVREEDVADRTELPGYFQQRELAPQLAEAAAFAVPSKVAAGGFRDGIPTVLVEAWLARTPVIGSPVAGIGEVLIDGVTGLVFPPDDAKALAGCIERLLASPDLGRTVADGGYRVAREEFSPERNVRALLDSIESAVAPSSR